MIDLRRSSYYNQSTARALNLGDTELVVIIDDPSRFAVMT